jgi:hypothetical protein
MEVTKVSFLFSLVVSLLIYHKRENLPGALIVPGSVLLLMAAPVELGVVFLSVSFAFVIYRYLIQGYIFKDKVFTRRETILVTVFLSLVFTVLIYAVLDLFFKSLFFGVVGIVTAGMLAEKLDRSWGRFDALEIGKSFLVAMILTLGFHLILLFLARNYLPVDYREFLNRSFQIDGLSRFSAVAMYVLFFVTILINYVLTKYYNFQFTGLIVGAYWGLIIFHPVYFLLTVISIGGGYWVVKFLSSYAFMYGFRVFVFTILLCASIFSFLQHFIASYFDHQFEVFFGMNIAIFALCGVTTQGLFQDGFKPTIKSQVILVAFLVPIILILKLIAQVGGWQLNFFS